GDGTSKYYGFSFPDMAFNLIGGTVGTLLEAYPALDRLFAYKASYRFRPAESPLVGHRSVAERYTPFPIDYDYLTFWLAVKGEALLPRSLSMLNLCVGYRIEGFETSEFPTPTRFWMLSVDVSFSSGLD